MVDSDSSLSSPPSSEDEMPVEIAPAASAKPTAPKKKKKNANILTFFKQRSPSPPPRKRPASPPRESVPEDNPHIAFIVMFRSRFSDAFPRGAPHVGPQDIEQGVAEGTPSADVEGLLCALLGLVLNRKKPVEKGHYGRALEEAIQTQKSQWPRQWTSNPLSGGRNFNSMAALERITLLHTLTLWSLNQNEQVKTMIANAYKSRSTKDKLDTNIPLSVQPWGRDGDKRRYWLVEGQSDTYFRIYRESDPKLKNVQWISVAGSIEELQALAKKLDEEDGMKEAKTLGERMVNAVPRFEASEVKRKRREYRLNRNAAFTKAEPGFSLYEGRTRGKRLRYTFDEEDEFDSDNFPTRRSGRHSGRETPAAPAGPTVTASGRQVRSRATGLYGETLHSGQVTDRTSPATGDYARSDVSEEPQQDYPRGRSTRAANGRAFNRAMESDEDDDATSWDGGDEDEDEPDQMDLDDDEEDVEDEADEASDEEPRSLVVTLRYGKGAAKPGSTTTHAGAAQSAATVNGAAASPAAHAPQHAALPLAGTGALRQPAPAPAPLPVHAHAPPPAPAPSIHTTAPYASNGVQHMPSTPSTSTLPIASPPPSQRNPTVLPPLGSLFPASLPPIADVQKQTQLPGSQFAVRGPPPVVQQPQPQQFAGGAVASASAETGAGVNVGDRAQQQQQFPSSVHPPLPAKASMGSWQ